MFIADYILNSCRISNYFISSYQAPENKTSTNAVTDEVVKEYGAKYSRDEIRGTYTSSTIIMLLFDIFTNEAYCGNVNLGTRIWIRVVVCRHVSLQHNISYCDLYIYIRPCTDMTKLLWCATELRSTSLMNEISAMLILSCTVLVSEILAECCK